MHIYMYVINVDVYDHLYQHHAFQTIDVFLIYKLFSTDDWHYSFRKYFTISLIMISFRPNFRWIRKTSKNLRYMTRRDREYRYLAVVWSFSDKKTWRTKRAQINRRYDKWSITFQKSYRYLFMRRKVPLWKRLCDPRKP